MSAWIICYCRQLKEICFDNQQSMSQQENTPKYIKQVPWYAQNDGRKTAPAKQSATAQASKQLQQWYDRGKKGFQATSFRKGACENCGAMGHSKKQCTERPRKVAAKYNQKNIVADDVVRDLDLDWESKRDRWNGYDPEMYKEVIEQFEQFEQIRKRKRLQQGHDDADNQFKDSVDALELSKLPTKLAKNKEFQGLTGVRNRQDFAKYLLNLNPNSDFFDPKSRSLKSYDNVAAQLDNLDPESERQLLLRQDRFAAQQVQLNNSELNTSGLPTMTEKIYKAYLQKTKNNARNLSNEHLKKYGQITTNKPLEVIEEDEHYEEYEQGERAKASRNMVKSRYEEDVIINDHLSVWGSWYNKYLGWGYACCHSTEKQSFCLGSKGKERALAAEMKAKAKHLQELQQIQQLEAQQQNQQQQQPAQSPIQQKQ